MSYARDFAGFALLAGGLFAAAGCATTSSGEDDAAESTEAALGESATITFDGAWNERVAGELRKGRKVKIAYDTDRLTQCRGEVAGNPGWTITGFWRIGQGEVHTFTAGGHAASPDAEPTFVLDASGDLELWFQNTSRWGCSAFDSNLGGNYHFAVAAAEHEPDWIGNTRWALDRMTCDGICDASLRPVDGEIRYDTWARQRAAVRVLTFEVWKRGVTDWDNPDRWRQLDVQVHSRIGSSGAFAHRYVQFDKRVGDNARYAVDLRALDPLPGHFTIQNASDCPAFPLTATNETVDAVVELYVTVNGVELRPAGPGSVYRARYVNYKALYEPCVH